MLFCVVTRYFKKDTDGFFQEKFYIVYIIKLQHSDFPCLGVVPRQTVRGIHQGRLSTIQLPFIASFQAVIAVALFFHKYRSFMQGLHY